MSAGELADLVRTAADLRQSVVPFGGRLSLGTGNVVPPADIGLDVTGWRGIHSYLPGDLTLSVASGTSYAEIADALAEHGQELPIDVPFPNRATIGGLIATGFAGPRRLGSGSLKDLIIGCDYVRGDGLQCKAGGMVVKNVSGFEIPRLLHGSWGSLAVLTSVNLKVIPTPRSEVTLKVDAESMASALDQAGHFLESQPALFACTVTRRRDDISLALRVMGREQAVEAIIDSLVKAAAAPANEIRVLDPLASRAFWQSQAEEWMSQSSDVVVCVGTRPRDVSQVVSAVNNLFESAHAAADMNVSPGTGSVRFRIDPALVSADQFRDRWGGTNLPQHTVAYIESAPTGWKRGTNVWLIDSASDTLMQAIKRQFDPHGILNPGRLFI